MYVFCYLILSWAGLSPGVSSVHQNLNLPTKKPIANVMALSPPTSLHLTTELLIELAAVLIISLSVCTGTLTHSTEKQLTIDWNQRRVLNVPPQRETRPVGKLDFISDGADWDLEIIIEKYARLHVMGRGYSGTGTRRRKQWVSFS